MLSSRGSAPGRKLRIFLDDLPTTFADLAWSARYRVDTMTLAAGGETLAGHVARCTRPSLSASR